MLKRLALGDRPGHGSTQSLFRERRKRCYAHRDLRSHICSRHRSYQLVPASKSVSATCWPDHRRQTRADRFDQFEGPEQRNTCQYDQAGLDPAQWRKTQTLLKRLDPEDQNRPGKDEPEDIAERHIVPDYRLADTRAE
mgnify:CR=1 FL=1